MSRLRIRVLIATLVAIHLAMALLLNPNGLVQSPTSIEMHARFLNVGALVAQPALLALWAAVGPQAFWRRWSLVLGMLGCLVLAHQFAEVNNASMAGQPGRIMQPVIWLVAFLTCQVVLWLPRRKFRWRIESPAAAGRPVGASERQFSMRGLLAATTGLAVFLAALRWIDPTSDLREWHLHLLRIVAIGAMTALPGTLAILVVWLVLAEGPRRRWQWFIAVFGLIVLTAVAAAVARFGSPGEVGELAFYLLGTRVTQEGADWLRAQRPGAMNVIALTNDVTLRRLSDSLRDRRTRMSQRAPLPATFLVRANGPVVTDAGVAALRGTTSIAELDLTDARLTDAAVNDLGTLGGLRKLMLRGTGVSEAGIDALRKKLPDCEIVR